MRSLTGRFQRLLDLPAAIPHSAFCILHSHVTDQSTDASFLQRVQRSDVGLPENSWRSLQAGQTA
jgi:hypothetical protein